MQTTLPLLGRVAGLLLVQIVFVLPAASLSCLCWTAPDPFPCRFAVTVSEDSTVRVFDFTATSQHCPRWHEGRIHHLAARNGVAVATAGGEDAARFAGLEPTFLSLWKQISRKRFFLLSVPCQFLCHFSCGNSQLLPGAQGLLQCMTVPDCYPAALQARTVLRACGTRPAASSRGC